MLKYNYKEKYFTKKQVKEEFLFSDKDFNGIDYAEKKLTESYGKCYLYPQKEIFKRARGKYGRSYRKAIDEKRKVRDKKKEKINESRKMSKETRKNDLKRLLEENKIPEWIIDLSDSANKFINKGGKNIPLDKVIEDYEDHLSVKKRRDKLMATRFLT